jgi:hypothetical protein
MLKLKELNWISGWKDGAHILGTSNFKFTTAKPAMNSTLISNTMTLSFSTR